MIIYENPFYLSIASGVMTGLLTGIIISRKKPKFALSHDRINWAKLVLFSFLIGIMVGIFVYFFSVDREIKVKIPMENQIRATNY